MPSSSVDQAEAGGKGLEQEFEHSCAVDALELYLNSAITEATNPYRALRENIAAMLDVYTTTGSSVTPKIAGIESTAKITSESSMTAKTQNSGVAFKMPSSRTKNLSPR